MSDYYIKSGHGISKRSSNFYEYLHGRYTRSTSDEDLWQLLKEWATEEKNNMPTNRKMVLYAGHDSTVANLLSALNVWDAQVPGYGITVFLEFSQDRQTGEHGIEVKNCL